MITNFCSTLAGHHLKNCKKDVDKLESNKGLELLICRFIQLGEKEAEEIPRSGYPYTYEEVTDKVQPG